MMLSTQRPSPVFLKCNALPSCLLTARSRTASHHKVRTALVARVASVQTFTADVATTNDSDDASAFVSDATAQQSGHESEDRSDVFTWTRHWWPVAPLDTLDYDRPTPHTILNQDLVVWYSKTENQWVVLKDQCPHRLAPLSQGRIVNGSLICSYHGWEFNTTGACTKIPQVEAKDQSRACGLKRTCASRYPTMVENNCLFVWMDNSAEGLRISTTKGVPVPPVGAMGATSTKWIMMNVPNDFRSWVEQSMDPSHASFLHAGSGFKMEDAIPMQATSLPVVHPTKGFMYEHGGYEKKNKGMRATRDFIPPCHIMGVYHQPFGKLVLNTMLVPIKPGYARTIANFAFMPASANVEYSRDSVNPATMQAPAPIPHVTPNNEASGDHKQQLPPAVTERRPNGALAAVLAQIRNIAVRLVVGNPAPHWVLMNYDLGDQDTIIMHYQEHVLRRNGVTESGYTMPAMGADVGVAAINKWLKMVGYPESLYGSSAPIPEQLSLTQLLDRQSRHVQSCVQCQQGLRLVTKLCWAVTGASALLGMTSLGLISVALMQGLITTAGLPALVVGALGIALASAALRLWDYREEKFISGVKSWDRKGGLSMVQRE